mmetsp:Transcript_122593/g.329362  ORF Transcript_122593/g.329362 Transcript_122593/m.329362 type:complete len:220 (-) Transcript_122593:290-949(-)
MARAIASRRQRRALPRRLRPLLRGAHRALQPLAARAALAARARARRGEDLGGRLGDTLVGEVPRSLDEVLDRHVVRVTVRSETAHLVEQTAVPVLFVVAGNLAIAQHRRGLVEAVDHIVAAEVRPLVVDEHDAFWPQLHEILVARLLLAPQLREPLLGVVHDMAEHVRLVVVHLLDGWPKALPLPALLVGAIVHAGAVGLDHGPDHAEVVRQPSYGQQV